MKKLLLIATLLLAVQQAAAASVDLGQATASAQRFMMSHVQGPRLTAMPGHHLKLLHAEPNSSSTHQAVYYIFNADQGFVIVAGDDRAREILAYGDRPLDLNRMPANMKFWLGTYKHQLEFLQARPGLVVEKSAQRFSAALPTIPPMLTAEWDQDEPYWNHCPVYNGEYCLTGCPATSLSMVFHHWKFPVDPTPEVPGYTNMSTGSRLPALPPITFDWDNMLDKYTPDNYTTVQADAVAWLMRYIGQEERMDYSPEGSGALGDDILRAVKFFGYDNEAELVTKSTADYYGTETELINDADWAEMLITEMVEGRPVVYCAYDYNNERGWSGHAFNVDGYTPGTDTYHVNWGWSGIGNGDFALNAFSYRDYTFNIEQQMVIGIQPPIMTPTIRVSPGQVEMNSYVEQHSTATIHVIGRELVDGVTVSLVDEDGVFSIDQTIVPLTAATDGCDITVTYSPLVTGSNSATVILTSPEADTVTVPLHGTAVLEAYVPVVQAADEASIGLTQFRADWTDQTLPKYVTSYSLEVNTKPGVMLTDEADWTAVTEGSTNYASFPDELLPAGWAFNGTGLWCENGGVSINSKSAIITPSHDLAGYEHVTVVVTARSSMMQSNSRFTVATSVDSQEFTAVGGAPFTRYVAVLACDELDQVTIAGKGGYPVFQSIQVYAGELDETRLGAAAESGGADYRLVTGLTDQHYTVTGLTAGGTFYYRVKAYYIDGTESSWSRSRIVTLAQGSHLAGDVDHDGSLSIADASALLDLLLTGREEGACLQCADVDGNGQVDIADVSLLIDLLLTAV